MYFILFHFVGFNEHKDIKFLSEKILARWAEPVFQGMTF